MTISDAFLVHFLVKKGYDRGAIVMKSYTKVFFEEIITAKVGEIVDIDLEPVVDDHGNHLWKMNPLSDATKKQLQLIDESMRAERANVQRFSFKVLTAGTAKVGFHVPRVDGQQQGDETSCTAQLIVEAR